VLIAEAEPLLDRLGRPRPVVPRGHGSKVVSGDDGFRFQLGHAVASSPSSSGTSSGLRLKLRM